jgi:hypothetical protein
MGIESSCKMRRGPSDVDNFAALLWSIAGRIAPLLFRRSRIGVSFYFPSLLVHNAAQLALHRFERVVNHLVDRLVRAIVHLLFISDELVATRHRHIDSAPVRISLVVRVIGLLDGHIAAVDVVAKFFKPCGVIQNEIVDLVRFFQTPIGDLNRQLHD